MFNPFEYYVPFHILIPFTFIVSLIGGWYGNTVIKFSIEPNKEFIKLFMFSATIGQFLNYFFYVIK